MNKFFLHIFCMKLFMQEFKLLLYNTARHFDEMNILEQSLLKGHKIPMTYSTRYSIQI